MCQPQDGFDNCTTRHCHQSTACRGFGQWRQREPRIMGINTPMWPRPRYGNYLQLPIKTRTGARWGKIGYRFCMHRCPVVQIPLLVAEQAVPRELRKVSVNRLLR